MRLTEKQSGVSLTEVLVAVMVLALAVVGAAALQWRALRAAHEAALQSAAARIAADLAEHLHAFHGRADNGFARFAFDAAAGREITAVPCHAASCTPAQLAAYEMQDLARRARETLPEGRILVCRDAVPWDPDRQAADWSCAEGEGAAVAPLVVKIGWRSRQDSPGARIRPLLVQPVFPSP
ncbi:type IV pilus modification protein PilV [Noviherbaspirillum aridicola]|uniref:Type IV pilin Tt1218-like domain-containing protein n=1 Tax=Noviherbaspirillum aridicola TaxID=2849687 RepID=A0ABQ4Q9V0_9BURK|nr:type IV pilus modification protein PilV [Noviherbaspirillum aridicola]GIZ53837.1 hypothetical protein NCCP691_38510 [Noviherbaspirillum aridicola]